jgi:CDP-diacylglycerol--serine O-phosphatidyltransferase
MALFPIYLNFELGIDLARAPMLVALWLALVGILMASRLPTFSPKALRVPRSAIVWVMIALPFAVGIMLTRFWLSLILIDALYALSLLQSALRSLISRRRGGPAG